MSRGLWKSVPVLLSNEDDVLQVGWIAVLPYFALHGAVDEAFSSKDLSVSAWANIEVRREEQTVNTRFGEWENSHKEALDLVLGIWELLTFAEHVWNITTCEDC